MPEIIRRNAALARFVMQGAALNLSNREILDRLNASRYRPERCKRWTLQHIQACRKKIFPEYKPPPRLVIDKETLGLIVGYRVTGMEYRRIAEILNLNGITTPTGKEWTENNVNNYYLENVAGMFLSNADKESTDEPKKRSNQAPDQIGVV